jgi:hypothetical protein
LYRAPYWVCHDDAKTVRGFGCPTNLCQDAIKRLCARLDEEDKDLLVKHEAYHLGWPECLSELSCANGETTVQLYREKFVAGHATPHGSLPYARLIYGLLCDVEDSQLMTVVGSGHWASKEGSWDLCGGKA